MQQMVKG